MSTQSAQQDPAGTYSNAIQQIANGEPPTRQQTEELIIATCVVTPGLQAFLPYIVAGIALVEGAAWVAQELGFGGNFCDHPPIDENDVRWTHFDNDMVGWARGIPSGPFANPTPGSFEAFVLPILKTNWEKPINCRAFVDYRAILDVASAAWNATHAGPAEKRATNDFQLPDMSTQWGYPAFKWPIGPKSVDGSTFPPTITPYDDHTITINRGDFVGVEGLRGGKGGLCVGDACGRPSSTGTSVATGVAAVGGTALAATVIYSLIVGKSATAVLDKLWEGAKRAVRRV